MKIDYNQALKHPLFEYITKAAEELQVDTYVIGGFVRDYILQRGKAKDVDIVCVGSGIELAKKVASLLPNNPKVQVFKTYGTAMLKYNDIRLNLLVLEKNLIIKIVEIQ